MDADEKKVKGEMSKGTFALLLFLAIFVDIIGLIIGFLGTVFIAVVKGFFFISGIKTEDDGLIPQSVLWGAIELLPAVPGSTGFVITSYIKNKKAVAGEKKKKKKVTIKGRLARRRMNVYENRLSARQEEFNKRASVARFKNRENTATTSSAGAALTAAVLIEEQKKEQALFAAQKAALWAPSQVKQKVTDIRPPTKVPN